MGFLQGLQEVEKVVAFGVGEVEGEDYDFFFLEGGVDAEDVGGVFGLLEGIVGTIPFLNISASSSVNTLCRYTKESSSCSTIPSIRLSWTRKIVRRSLKHSGARAFRIS